MRLALDSIQSEIVRGYRRGQGDDPPAHGAYLLLRFDERPDLPHPRRARARAFLQDLLPRTVVLDEGRIVADGPTARILADGELLEAHGLESLARAAN